MKISPTLSHRIRHFILKLGVEKSTLYITAISTLLSVVIAKLVANLLPGSSGNFNIAIAITVPFLIAPPFGYIFMSLYFELEKLREEVHILAITDDLTSVFNRRHFMKLATHELERV